MDNQRVVEVPWCTTHNDWLYSPAEKPQAVRAWCREAWMQVIEGAEIADTADCVTEDPSRHWISGEPTL